MPRVFQSRCPYYQVARKAPSLLTWRSLNSLTSDLTCLLLSLLRIRWRCRCLRVVLFVNTRLRSLLSALLFSSPFVSVRLHLLLSRLPTLAHTTTHMPMHHRSETKEAALQRRYPFQQPSFMGTHPGSPCVPY